MRTLAITYEADAGPGVFAEAVEARGGTLDTWLRTASEAPPAPATDYDAVLCLGGSMHVDQTDRHPWLARDRLLLGELLEAGTPLMGVCLGAQLLTLAAGGEVERLEDPEIGWYRIEPTAGAAGDPLMAPLTGGFDGFEWHSYGCTLPPGATELARSDGSLQSYRSGNAWAIQFHAEVTLEDAESWIDEYRRDEDAVRIGLEPEALRAETRAKIGPWNELGREFCGRFLDAAG